LTLTAGHGGSIAWEEEEQRRSDRCERSCWYRRPVRSGDTRTNRLTHLKAVLMADMLLGRVEIVALLVLFYPRTWFGRRG